ncbi:MAG: hypothetical protein QG636_656 [Patescibacteria group bacterium]|nr:hypothetical protein [Patescibacteria group bacterium]
MGMVFNDRLGELQQHDGWWRESWGERGRERSHGRVCMVPERRVDILQQQPAWRLSFRHVPGALR